MTIAVVGAGLAGLSAAYELVQAGAEVIVLESERRAGGVIVTERPDGFVVEGGPDGFLAVEPEIPALAGELGIAARLVRPTAHGSALWTGSALRPLDEGEAAALLGIQARAEDLLAGHLSFAGGMAELVEALAGRIGALLRTGMGVAGLAPSRTGYRLSVTGGSVVEAEGVVVALPAPAAARLLLGTGVPGAPALGEVPYRPSLTVSLAYERRQVAGPLEGTGFVVRPGTSDALFACSFASSKFPNRAPAGHVLLRAFLARDDRDPAGLAHRSLAPILAISGEPLWGRVFYWPRGLPQYPPGHAARVAKARERLAALPPLALAGAGFDGPGVSACVRSGRAAAREILRRLDG